MGKVWKYFNSSEKSNLDNTINYFLLPFCFVLSSLGRRLYWRKTQICEIWWQNLSHFIFWHLKKEQLDFSETPIYAVLLNAINKTIFCCQKSRFRTQFQAWFLVYLYFAWVIITEKFKISPVQSSTLLKEGWNWKDFSKCITFLKL